MNFSNITDNTKCPCLDVATEDNTTMFARRIGKQKSLKIRDFKTYIDKGKEFDGENLECNEICGMFGLSMDIWTVKSQDEIKQKYMTTIGFSPKLKNHIAVLKLKKGAGMIVHTPTSDSKPNPYHYDFFKSDNFEISHLDLVDLIPIRPIDNV